MSVEANKQVALRHHDEVFVQGNLALTDELYAPGFVMHTPGLPLEMTQGGAGIRLFATLIRAAWSELEITTDESLAADDRVIHRFTVRARHTGEFLGVPATRKRFTVTGIDIFRITGDQIAEQWLNWDALGFMQQVGAIPVLEAVEE